MLMETNQNTEKQNQLFYTSIDVNLALRFQGAQGPSQAEQDHPMQLDASHNLMKKQPIHTAKWSTTQHFGPPQRPARQPSGTVSQLSWMGMKEKLMRPSWQRLRSKVSFILVFSWTLHECWHTKDNRYVQVSTNRVHHLADVCSVLISCGSSLLFPGTLKKLMYPTFSP